MNVIIVSSKDWHRKHIREIELRTGHHIIYVSDKEAVTFENFMAINPKYVFIPHWSYIIPDTIFKHFCCIVFHETDLPYGRGGSPIQNLIARGIYETQISALRCTSELDGGDIYIKRPLSLWGSAEEIFLRSAAIIKDMIIELINGNYEPTPQQGTIVYFNRRKPEEGNISNLNSLEKVFDYIRMLDADTYPPAFLDVNNLHLEFSRASLRDQYLEANVRITLRENCMSEQ